jgi:hypothetical protein
LSLGRAHARESLANRTQLPSFNINTGIVQLKLLMSWMEAGRSWLQSCSNA